MRSSSSAQYFSIGKAASTKKTAQSVPPLSVSDDGVSEALPELSKEDMPLPKTAKTAPARKSVGVRKVNYTEVEED